MSLKRTLDLGCGPNPRNLSLAEEVYGVDINNFDKQNIRVADLAIEPIPFEDNFFVFVSGFDFLEHIPRVIYFRRDKEAILHRYCE